MIILYNRCWCRVDHGNKKLCLFLSFQEFFENKVFLDVMKIDMEDEAMYWSSGVLPSLNIMMVI